MKNKVQFQKGLPQKCVFIGQAVPSERVGFRIAIGARNITYCAGLLSDDRQNYINEEIRNLKFEIVNALPDSIVSQF